VLALASCGSLRTDLPVGSVMCPDDFLAPWCAPTFHADGGHIVPGFDLEWRSEILAAWEGAAAAAAPEAPKVVDGGVYAQTTGPRFETPAEVRMLATFADVVGMTLAGEAVLAGEVGLRYAAICTVDNLANGLGPSRLTPDEYHAGVAGTRRHVGPVMKELLARLVRQGAS
jgi:5'-methylthioadenosine phosphorylase